MTNSITKTKSKAFAIRIVKLYKYLQEEKQEFISRLPRTLKITAFVSINSQEKYGITYSLFTLLRIHLEKKGGVPVCRRVTE